MYVDVYNYLCCNQSCLNDANVSLALVLYCPFVNYYIAHYFRKNFVPPCAFNVEYIFRKKVLNLGSVITNRAVRIEIFTDRVLLEYFIEHSSI